MILGTLSLTMLILGTSLAYRTEQAVERGTKSPRFSCEPEGYYSSAGSRSSASVWSGRLTGWSLRWPDITRSS